MFKRAAAIIVALWFFHQGAMLGILVQPWAPFWLSGQTQITTAALPEIGVPGPPPDPGDLNPHPGHATDQFRYQLARSVGWSQSDAIIAVAISLAEDGSGDPAAISGVNRNGTRDLGLWQINSNWWPEFGGHDALVVPINNAHAAIVIFGRQGWCAWSTYGPCPTHPCGPPCYLDFLSRARAAATLPLPPGEA